MEPFSENLIFETHAKLIKKCRSAVRYMKDNKHVFTMLENYKGPWFGLLNQTLRKRKKLQDIELIKLDDCLTKMISKQTWDLDIPLYRTLSGNYAKEIYKKKVGDVFVDSAFISTAFDSKFALNFEEKEKLLLIIKVKPGTPFLYIDGMRNIFKCHNKWIYQTEVLFGKNTVFTITKKEASPKDCYLLSNESDCSIPSFIKSKVNIMYVTIH